MRAIVHVLIVAVLLVSVAACGKKTGGANSADVDYWTCTMHPSVHAKDPGKCPICSMDLVPVMKKENAGSGAETHTAMPNMPGMSGMPGMGDGQQQPAGKSHEFMVPAERQQQIGVTYATAERRPLQHSIRAVGLVHPDVSRDWQFVARIDGYVQKLHVTSPGEIVEKDAPLLSIYSPDLLTTERELVELLRMRDQARSAAARRTPAELVEAAKRRLKQWNVTDEQIAALEQSRAPGENLTLLSPFRGVVQSVPVQQGKAVRIGEPLVDVADLSVVWVWADFYESELSMLRQGQKITVMTNSYPGEKFAGEIALINPFLDQMKRTARVRIDIPNPDFKLQPGMYANVELEMQMGEGLTVPVSAVMPTGSRNIVFVDKGGGKLEPRIVQLGAKFGDSYEIKDGLAEGERVVSSANFLIDAESKVQGALNDLQPEAKP